MRDNATDTVTPSRHLWTVAVHAHRLLADTTSLHLSACCFGHHLCTKPIPTHVHRTSRSLRPVLEPQMPTGLDAMLARTSAMFAFDGAFDAQVPPMQLHNDFTAAPDSQLAGHALHAAQPAGGMRGTRENMRAHSHPSQAPRDAKGHVERRLPPQAATTMSLALPTPLSALR